MIRQVPHFRVAFLQALRPTLSELSSLWWTTVSRLSATSPVQRLVTPSNMAGMAENKVQEAAPLLDEESKNLYKGEKEPGQKSQIAAVEGIPFQYTSVHGVPLPPQPMMRQAWKTGLFDCVNISGDEWAVADNEICALGWLAPCVLYASNKERSVPQGKSLYWNSCCLYLGLMVAGKALFHCNAIAPCFTYSSRTHLRQKYSLQGDAEKLQVYFGCMPARTDEGRERIESYMDCLTHYFCHCCALCQEARELRRQTPTFATSPAPMAPPAHQLISGSS